MTLTIYIPPSERRILERAKQAVKRNKDSISRVAMDAIRAYAEANKARK